MKIQIKTSVLCLLLTWAVIPVQGITLNEIELKSHLNETLDARIALGGLKSGDLEGMSVRVLAPEVGMGISPSMIKLEVKDDGNGHYIQLTSRENIREPIINFTLEVTWAEGRFIREYSVLVDPKD
jgi:pilus assembly protein FimV